MFYILFLRFSKYKHVIICVSMKLSSKKVMWFFKVMHQLLILSIIISRFLVHELITRRFNKLLKIISNNDQVMFMN